MNLRKTIPAVLLLTLAVPPVQARSIQAPGSRAGTAPAQNLLTGPNCNTANAARVRRRGESDESSGLSAETVSLACEYLNAGATKLRPSPQAALAWELFYPSCDAVIRRFAGKLRSRGVDVDDCAQEVWAELLVSLPGFKFDPSRGRFTSWLYSVVRSRANDILRRDARRPTARLTEAAEMRADQPAIDPARVVEAEEERNSVRGALEKLRERTSTVSYRVLHLRCMEQMSVPQVAEALGLSPEQVWVREHRMKRKLREMFPRNKEGRDVRRIAIPKNSAQAG